MRLRIFLTKASFILAFILPVGSSVRAADAASSLGSEARVTPLTAAEPEAFYGALELEARKFYDVHSAQMPNMKRALWERMVRQSVLRLRQMGVGVKALARYARPAAGTFMVTNIVSTFILPPILTAAGFPGLAMLVLAVPFEPFVAAGQVFVMRSMDDLRLLRSIGLSDFIAMKQLRRDLLGMSERAHILTVIESDMLKEIRDEGGPLWLSISSNKQSKGTALALSEIEDIVRMDPKGEAWLEELTPQKLSRQLYALELWFFVQERRELRETLLKRLKAHKAANTSDAVLAKQMHQLIDLRNGLREAEDRLGSEIKSGAKAMPAAERKALKELVSDLGEQSNALIRSVDLAESHLLLSQVQGTPRLVDDLSSSVKLLQERIQVFDRVLVEARGLKDDRRVTSVSLRRSLNFVEFPSKPPGTCTSALRSLMAKFAN